MWNEIIDSTREFSDGRLDRVNGERKIGNIRGDDGSSYFFRFSDVRARYSDLTPGTKVRFSKERRFDAKKEQWNINAVCISVIK